MPAVSINLSANATSDSQRYVVYWLFGMTVLVAIMVVIGGITRLTGSGLSMVEWRPLMGALPPLSAGEWQRVFELYRASPEYEQTNYGMGLEDFIGITFWQFVKNFTCCRIIGWHFLTIDRVNKLTSNKQLIEALCR